MCGVNLHSYLAQTHFKPRAITLGLSRDSQLPWPSITRKKIESSTNIDGLAIRILYLGLKRVGVSTCRCFH